MADGEWDHTSDEWKSDEFLAWLFNESPCQRRGGDQRPLGQGLPAATTAATTRPSTAKWAATRQLGAGRKWEECRGIGATFGYNRNETTGGLPDLGYDLIRLLVNLVAKGGNLLLDIGPTADGRIPVIMQQRLIEMGDWLKVNGEAIYGTRSVDGIRRRSNSTGQRTRSRTHAESFSRPIFASRPRTARSTLFAWRLPTAEVRITSLGKTAGHASKAVAQVRLLGSDESLKWSQENDALVIQCPQRVPCAYAVTFKIEFAAGS